jgi:hypothetical protein
MGNIALKQPNSHLSTRKSQIYSQLSGETTMRKRLLTALAFIAMPCMAQQSTMMETSSTDFGWKVGESRHSAGYTLTRIEGDNASYKVTNAMYEPADTLIARRKQTVQTNFQPDSVWQSYAQRVRKYAPGGAVCLFVRRPTIAWGDRNNFTVAIKDSTDSSVLFRESMDERLPTYDNEEESSADYLQIASSVVDVALPDKFYLYVIDTYGTAERYKFIVRKN